MARRAQSLTPREREILDLVRVGLTNDEIAERLTITSDGVKYHVSQILTKLGVSSCHEAVAVAYGETRRRWWSAALAWTLLRTVAAITAVAAVAFVALLLWGVLESDDSSDSPDITGLTPTEVYDSVAQAATQSGQVLHSQIEATLQADGETTPYFTLELWIDAERERLRSEYHLAPEQDAYDQASEGTSIVVGEYVYVPDDPGEAHRYDVEERYSYLPTPPWLSTLLYPSPPLFSTTPSQLGEARIESGEFRDRGAVVLVFQDSVTGPVSDPDVPPASPPPLRTGPTPIDSPITVTGAPGETQTITSTLRIYLDANDYLPLASTITYTTDGDASDPPAYAEAVYENEFLPLAEMESLLDPQSIGYGAENAEVLLDEIEGDVPVYWLGEEFQGNGLGELVLARILVGEQSGGVEQVYRVGGQLIYEAPDGYPEVRLFLWPTYDWETFLTTSEGRILTDESCAQTHESQAGDLPVTVYTLPPIDFPGSSDQAPGETDCNFKRRQVALVDRVIGVIEFDDVVVQIRQDGYAETQASTRTLLQQLRSR